MKWHMPNGHNFFFCWGCLLACLIVSQFPRVNSVQIGLLFICLAFCIFGSHLGSRHFLEYSSKTVYVICLFIQRLRQTLLVNACAMQGTELQYWIISIQRNEEHMKERHTIVCLLHTGSDVVKWSKNTFMQFSACILMLTVWEYADFRFNEECQICCFMASHLLFWESRVFWCKS